MTMIAPLLLLFAVLSGGPAHEPPPAWAYQAAPLHAVPGPVTSVMTAVASRSLSPALAPSDELIPRAYLPIVSKAPDVCAPIPGVTYTTLSVNPPPTDRPAEQHPDLNLAIRGYEVTSAYLGLIEDQGDPDAKAPQLYYLFGDQRVPAFTTAYRVYDWDWSCDCRGGLLNVFPVTLLGMGVAPGEVIRTPDSGYDIGNGYDVLVLYASEERITLKYTREDNVVVGYTVHVENVCVDPSLLALYRAWNAAGRGQLPALRGGQPFGRARGGEIRVAIRDCGVFLDPRSRPGWWQVK